MSQAGLPTTQPQRQWVERLQAVDELTAAYARILGFVWSMRTFHRHSGDYAAVDSDGDTKLVRILGTPGLVLWPLLLLFLPIRGWWRTFMIRAVISLYVNTHINSSATKLSGVLIRERLRRLHASDPGAESLDRSIATLDRLKTATTGWIALLVVLRLVPVIGLLFSMGIVTVSFTLTDTPTLIRELIALLPLVVLLVHPVAVQFGFRWKRALFVDGGRDTADGSMGLPAASTYEIETRTYRCLGVKRSMELPVDLLLAPGFYFLLALVIGLAFGAVTFYDETQSIWQAVVDAVVTVAFAVLLAMATIRLVLRYGRRRATGLM